MAQRKGCWAQAGGCLTTMKKIKQHRNPCYSIL
jgi:hypothetical protein